MMSEHCEGRRALCEYERVNIYRLYLMTMSIAELRFFLLPQISGAVSWSTLSYMFSPLEDSGASDRLYTIIITSYHLRQTALGFTLYKQVFRIRIR